MGSQLQNQKKPMAHASAPTVHQLRRSRIVIPKEDKQSLDADRAVDSLQVEPQSLGSQFAQAKRFGHHLRQVPATAPAQAKALQRNAQPEEEDAAGAGQAKMVDAGAVPVQRAVTVGAQIPGRIPAQTKAVQRNAQPEEEDAAGAGQAKMVDAGAVPVQRAVTVRAQIPGRIPAQAKAVQRNAQPEEEDAAGAGQAKMVGSGADPVQRAMNFGASGSGESMPKPVRSKMENSFGTSFGDVKIHQNSMQAKSVGALAYTQGNQIHFAPGQYNPKSLSGQALLGHELTHVVQQRAGRVPVPAQSKGAPINADPALENEADIMGARAARGQFADVPGAPTAQRKQAPIQQKADSKAQSQGNVEQPVQQSQQPVQFFLAMLLPMIMPMIQQMLPQILEGVMGGGGGGSGGGGSA